MGMEMKKSMFLAIFLFLCLLTSIGRSAVLHVPADGYTTIQRAIDAASDGDEIEVAPGTYYEAINLLKKAIRLYSSGGAENTTINGTGNAHVVQCVLGEGSDTVLEGFKVIGGNADGIGFNSQGGGMLISGSNPTVINCIFTGNSAADGGGVCILSANPTLTNCTFSNNTAAFGAGMSNLNGSKPTVTNCTFSGNSATEKGGGVHNINSIPIVSNCHFTNNTAAAYGGGMYNDASSVSVINTAFVGNIAQNAKGGGIANYNNSNSTIINCMFYDNKASNDSGGGIRNWASSPTITNCIVWANLPDQISNQDADEVVVSHSNVEGTLPAGTTDGGGNVNGDPQFVNASGGDFRFLSSGSPCVDSGDNSVVTEPNDLADNGRIVDGDRDSNLVVDMGVYEYKSKLIHNVTQDIWYTRIQDAIDGGAGADEIEVGPDTYNEAVNFRVKSVRLYSSDGPEKTIIDASGLGASVVSCINGEGGDSTLQGFTLTGGIGTTSGSYKYGGGMYNNASSPTVMDCIITANTASGDGGGMYNTNGSPVLTGCIFKDNIATHAGGGIYNRLGSNPTVTDCNFISNIAGTYGGGIYNIEKSSPTVMDCLFSKNRTNIYDGGGVFNNSGTASYTGCKFEINGAKRHGGGMVNYNSSNPALTDCVFFNNTSLDDGGGMHNSTNSSPTVVGCTFDSNTSVDNGGGMYNFSNSNPTVTDCSFTNNLVNGEGGGMFNHTASPILTSCSFSSNGAAEFGGGITNYGSSHPMVTSCWFGGNRGLYGGGMHNRDSSRPTVTNCIFTRNEASKSGGGMSNYDSSHSIVTNCTFYSNAAGEMGGGIRNYKSSPTVTNCIVWGNSSDQVSFASSYTVFKYCDIQDGTGQSWFGTGCIDADPNFVDPDNADISLVNLALLPISCCIDAGDTTAVTAGVLVDPVGNPRGEDYSAAPNTGISFLGKITDIGAYEFNSCSTEADINCDGRVDLLDYAILAKNWLAGT